MMLSTKRYSGKTHGWDASFCGRDRGGYTETHLKESKSINNRLNKVKNVKIIKNNTNAAKDN